MKGKFTKVVGFAAKQNTDPGLSAGVDFLGHVRSRRLLLLSSLFGDKRLDTFDSDAGRSADLDNLKIAGIDKLVTLGDTDTDSGKAIGGSDYNRFHNVAFRCAGEGQRATTKLGTDFSDCARNERANLGRKRNRYFLLFAPLFELLNVGVACNTDAVPCPIEHIRFSGSNGRGVLKIEKEALDVFRT